MPNFEKPPTSEPEKLQPPSPEEKPAEKVPETVEKPPEEDKFELPGLKEAEEKNYPWLDEAEESRDFLVGKIKNTEDVLKQIENGVEEGSDLHKRLQEAAYFRFEERQRKGEAGTDVGDFLAAVEDFKKKNELEKEILEQRWKRLEVLSSEELGARDEELNEVAYSRAEKKAKDSVREITQLTREENIKCNDEARIELLKNLGKEITDKEIKERITQKEKEEEEKKKTAEQPPKPLEEKKEIPSEEKKPEKEGKTEKTPKKEYKGRIRLMSKREFLEEKTKIIGEKNRLTALRDYWKRLHLNESPTPRKIERFVNEVMTEWKRVKETIGMDLSDDMLCYFLDNGYNLEGIRKSGRLRKKIIIPRVTGEVEVFSTREFRGFIAENEAVFEDLKRQRTEKMWREARRKAERIMTQKDESDKKPKPPQGPDKPGGAEAPEKPKEAIAERDDKRMEYVAITDLTTRVKELGGHIRDFISQELILVINKGMGKIKSEGKDSLSTEEWNELMEKKEEARKLMEDWIRKHERPGPRIVKDEKKDGGGSSKEPKGESKEGPRTEALKRIAKRKGPEGEEVRKSLEKKRKKK